MQTILGTARGRCGRMVDADEPIPEIGSETPIKWSGQVVE